MGYARRRLRWPCSHSGFERRSLFALLGACRTRFPDPKCISGSPLPPFSLSVCPVQAQISLAARVSLEGRFLKAKPSMVISGLPDLALKPGHIKWKRTINFKLEP